MRDRPLRLGLGYFLHEATTFSPDKAGLKAFHPASYGGQALFSASEEIEGFAKFCSERPDVQVIPLESFGGVIGGSSVGWITREAFEHYWRLMSRSLARAMPLDGVYLALHGAAAVEGLAAPEVELARRVRELIGPKVPIAATFDPHGNQDGEFLRFAQIALSMKYYPHYDGRLQGERAARLLTRACRGDFKPTHAIRRPGIVTPTVVQWTGRDPWSSIVQRALLWEAQCVDAFVSVFFGFPWCDSTALGATVEVTTNADPQLAKAIADDMSDYIWRRRRELFALDLVSPRSGVARAAAAVEHGRRPVVLADYSDRTGDATHILAEVVRQGLGKTLVATVRDEHLIGRLRERDAQAGDAIAEDIGGFVLRPDSGEPVRVEGELLYFGPPAAKLGLTRSEEPVAIIGFGAGNVVVVTPYLAQIVYPEQMRFGPIEPARFDIWVVKSRVHFRRGFDDAGFAQLILLVDAPGAYLGTVHLEALPYRHADLKRLYPYSEGLRPSDLMVASAPAR
jgi:microcystin degradation protein MlrC